MKRVLRNSRPGRDPLRVAGAVLKGIFPNSHWNDICGVLRMGKLIWLIYGCWISRYEKEFDSVQDVFELQV